jgi:Na+-driven multidrug efflux pump
VASAFLARLFAGYGSDAVAAASVIDRLTPVAFGGLFALSGAIGPILAQNWGAGRFDRMRSVLRESMRVTLAYAVSVWLVLAFARGSLAALFGLTGVAAELFGFFCLVGGAIWFFNGLLFLGNAAFNNLGFPLRSTLLNWGRATLGTMPPAMLGAALYGPRGVVAGMGVGSLIFGVLGILLARRTVDRLEGTGPRIREPEIAPAAPLRAAPLPAGHAHPGPVS